VTSRESCTTLLSLAGSQVGPRISSLGLLPIGRCPMTHSRVSERAAPGLDLRHLGSLTEFVADRSGDRLPAVHDFGTTVRRPCDALIVENGYVERFKGKFRDRLEVLTLGYLQQRQSGWRTRRLCGSSSSDTS